MTRIVAGYVIAALAFLVLFVIGPFKALLLPHVSRAATRLTERHRFPEWATPASSRVTTYKAIGIVDAMEPESRLLTIDHGAVQGMGWPVWIKVRYGISDITMLRGIVIGQRVVVQFHKHGVDFEAIEVTPC